jgi:hypothetical protein
MSDPGDDGVDTAGEESVDVPPSREGLSDSEVWEWAGDHWRVRTIAPFEEPNAGGSPAPVDEP